MSELSPTDTLPLLSTIDTLDDLPLLTEVVAAAVIPEVSPPDPVETLSAQLLRDETAYQKLLARLDAHWAARGTEATVPPSDDSMPSVVSMSPSEKDQLLHLVESTPPSDDAVELPTEVSEWCVEEIFPTTAEPSASTDEPMPELNECLSVINEPRQAIEAVMPVAEEVMSKPLPEHSLDASQIAELEAHLERRLDEKLAALPIVSGAPTLSEEEYERVVDRLEDHLENLLHQKLEIYLERIKPSIVAQVMEEIRLDAIQLLHATDEDGT